MPPSIKSASSVGKVWFVQNMTREGPAFFSELLQQRKIPFGICDLEKGDELPRVGPQDAVVVLGGSMSANDTTDSMLRLLKWIQTLLQNEVPYLGICLGLQTLVKAAGGKVVKNPVKEIGLKTENREPYLCTLTDAGQKDLLLEKIPKTFPIFQLHGETVVLTETMTLLARGKWCQNQIVKAGTRAYGLQGHLEVTRQTVKDWLSEDDDLMKLDAQALLGDFAAVEKDLHLFCGEIFCNFLKIAGMMK